MNPSFEKSSEFKFCRFSVLELSVKVARTVYCGAKHVTGLYRMPSAVLLRHYPHLISLSAPVGEVGGSLHRLSLVRVMPHLLGVACILFVFY